MAGIRFKAKLHEADEATKIGPATLITLPNDASAQLPSRGMTMVEGTINGSRFRTVLEPNGEGSHWFKVDKAVCKATGVNVGDTASLEIQPTKMWPEPKVPTDLQQALADDPQAHALWMNITPMARWDWINWMDIVKLNETRQVRPAKLCSMLKAGKRRPCCFNRTLLMTPQSAELL